MPFPTHICHLSSRKLLAAFPPSGPFLGVTHAVGETQDLGGFHLRSKPG